MPKWKLENIATQQEKEVAEEKSAEIVSSSDELMEQKIDAMEIGVAQLEQGSALDKIADSVNLSEEEIMSIQQESGVRNRLDSISERAKELLKSTKRFLRNAAVLGMVGMASSTSSTTNNIDKSEHMSTPLDEKTRELTQEALISKTESIKNRIEIHVASQDYLKRLVIEFDGDIEKAEKIQKERMQYVQSLKYQFDTLRQIAKKNDLPDGKDKWIPQWLIDMDEFLYGRVRIKAGAFYDPEKHEMMIPNEGDRVDSFIRHEVFHASTKADKGISDKAKKIMNESYKEFDNNKVNNSYFIMPTERLARKQEVDFELERLGIKKYGERATRDHYDKLMEHAKRGDLSREAYDFLKTTKPEYFEKIFNEIASDEDKLDKNQGVV